MLTLRNLHCFHRHWWSVCASLIVLLIVASVPSPSRAQSSSHHVNSNKLDTMLKESISDVRRVLIMRTQKFDEFFRELLKNSKRDFHQMFLQTYGLLYERNSYIFTDMFHDLEQYYANGNVDLNEALDAFFQRLYQKMFQVLNAQYTFDEVYLQCVGKLMDELKPFGDIPKKLKIEVKRSFVATRTFVQALINGQGVLTNLMQTVHSFDCYKLLHRATNKCTHCQPSASGGDQIRPCSSVCTGVMRSCLSKHTELNKEWNNYIDALLLLSSRLETSFNIESVVDPIDIKISEAIMNFQENGIVVSQKLFEKCGKPRIGKRSAPSSADDDHHYEDRAEELMDNGFDDFNAYRTQRHNPHTSSSRMVAAGTSMDRLIQDIKRKIKKTKNFWHKIPQSICTHNKLIAEPSATDRNCWNGTEIIPKEVDRSSSKYEAEFNKFVASISPPPRNPNLRFGQQILSLKLLTTKVNYAFNGLEVEWQEKSADSDQLSGSGSGDLPDEDDSESDFDYSHGPVHRPAGKDTSDIYFGPSSTETSEVSSTADSATNQMNNVPNNLPPSPSGRPTRIPNHINVLYTNNKKRVSSGARTMTYSNLQLLSSLSICIIVSLIAKL